MSCWLMQEIVVERDLKGAMYTAVIVAEHARKVEQARWKSTASQLEWEKGSQQTALYC